MKMNEIVNEASDPAVHLKKAKSAADRDEQELYVKHMIQYHKAMAKANPDDAAKHNKKVKELKDNIGEK